MLALLGRPVATNAAAGNGAAAAAPVWSGIRSAASCLDCRFLPR